MQRHPLANIVVFRGWYLCLCESDSIACYFRDYMDQFTSIYGREKFLEWPYVHHLSTHSNSKGCSSLITSGLEIATITMTHWGLQTIMTNVDQAEAVAITIHSRSATDTEILMTEFVACYLTADIAWCMTVIIRKH
jgi:hypothetical protein